MPKLAITIEGAESVLDTDNLMLSELVVLEEHAGVDIEILGNAESLRSMRMIGHLLWLLKLRAVAAEESIDLNEAAIRHPRAGFDVAVGTLDIQTVKVPKGGPGATTTTRTPRAGSSAPRARSRKSTAPKSAGSPSS